jgi:hypothetical protein
MTVKSTASDTGTPVLKRAMEFTLPGIEVPRKDLLITLRLRADPLEGYPASIGRRLNISAKSGDDTRKATKEFTWANGEPFTAMFYFKEVGPGRVNLGFEVEGDQPVHFERLAAHSAADGRYREYENGVVFANPSVRPYTFEVAKLFPGASFRRLQGSENQDPETNDGRPLGEELTLRPQDALFVVRSDG